MKQEGTGRETGRDGNENGRGRQAKQEGTGRETGEDGKRNGKER